jgi:WD40 repeat protein
MKNTAKAANAPSAISYFMLLFALRPSGKFAHRSRKCPMMLCRESFSLISESKPYHIFSPVSDLELLQLLREFKGHTDVIDFGVAFSPDGQKIITSSWDKTVRIWDIGTGQELYRFVGDTYGVNSVAFSPDGKYILTGGDNGVGIWDAETGLEVRQLSGVDQVYGAVFSPDGKYIATASNSADGTALWDANTDKMLHRFTGTGRVNTVDFSPDGKYLLSTDHDGIAWFWDIQTWKMLRQFVGHSAMITGADYLPDGKYAATASYGGTARLWDAQTGRELRRFAGHTNAVENVIFSPDGKYILTGSDDGTAMLWDVDYHTTMKYLCSQLKRDFTDDERAQYGIKDTTPTCPEQ